MRKLNIICLFLLMAIPVFTFGQPKQMAKSFAETLKNNRTALTGAFGKTASKLNQQKQRNVILLSQMEAQNKKSEDASKEMGLPDHSHIFNNPTFELDGDIRRILKVPTADSPQDHLGSIMLNTIEEANCDSCKLVVYELGLDTLSGEIEKEALFHIIQVKQGAKINNDTTGVIVTKHSGIYPRSGIYPEGCPTYEISVECYRTGLPVPEHIAKDLTLQVAKILIPGYIEFSTPIIPKGGMMLTVPSNLINNTPKQ